MTKKFKIILSIIILTIGILGINTNSLAATGTWYFGVTEEKITDEPNIGYAIGDPNANGETWTAAKIWEFVQYSSSNFTDPTRINVYCVKAGVGFSDLDKTATYNVSYNFKTETSQIAELNDILSGLINDGQYYNILALSDLFYITGTSTDAEKTTLLENAGIYESQWDTILTNDEIEVIQQAALWYFTNYGEDDGLFDKYNSTSWLNYTIDDGATYDSFSEYNPSNTIPSESYGTKRQEQAEMLYKYLIDTAKANSSNYENGTANSFTTITLYASTTNNQEQPLIVIGRETGEFDLALRKNITEINGEEITNTKIPDIDLSSLEDGTTATYDHRKDPLIVETGDTVTYNLTIYNEGEIDGRAIEITDQLPTGLEFSKIITDGFDIAYDLDSNTLTITRSMDNDDNLSAYTDGNLDYEVIEIECTVTATASMEEAITLTNVAWISEDYNDLGIADRDSDPTVSPSVNKNNMEDYIGNTSNKDELQDSEYYYEGEQDDDDFDKLIIPINADEFDLKLIKMITAVNNATVENRIEDIDITNLANGSETTAEYTLNKTPIGVSIGDIVTYTIRVYNEGDIDGYASEITEDIPEGLSFISSSTIDTTTASEELLDAIEFNTNYGWTETNVNGETMITTNYLSKDSENVDGDNLINAFDSDKAYSDEDPENPDYKEVQIQLVVTTDDSQTVIRNEAAITNDSDSEGNDITDRDSDTEDWVKYEDDEDYDNIVIESFDLALRKNITKVNGVNIEDSKVPTVDTSSLETGTTATYDHYKSPITVETGDVVTYNLTIYNEGQVDGRALEIIDQLPTGLEFKTLITDGFSAIYDEETNIVTIIRDSDNTTDLNGYGESSTLDSEVIEIECVVTAEESRTETQTLTNVAWISEYYNEKGLEDRDSSIEESPDVNKDNMEDYKGDSTNKDDLSDDNYYYEGEEDDDDFDKLILGLDTREFDLKLIKMITAVNDEEVENRIENIDITNLANGSETTAEYTLDKTPVTVTEGDLVTYTFRIYNEGEIDGYASEITENIPEGLKFLGTNIDEDMNEITDEEILAAVEFNASMGWTYTTVDGEEMISTNYLAKGNGQDIIDEGTNLIKAFDKDAEYSDEEPLNPDYKEVSVILQVTALDSEDGIIRNEAAITEATDDNGDEIEDRDSSTEDWEKYEDDEDYDNIILKDFDLALRKFIIAVSSDTTIEETEYLINTDGTYTREPVVDTSLLNSTDEDGNIITTATYTHTKEPVLVQKEDIVIYMFRIYNEGELDGYAGEITDYLPSYLEYVDSEFNTTYGWSVSDDGRVVTTTYLDDKLVSKYDGETLDYVEVPIMCIVSSESNTNENITNIAEITKYLDEDKEEIEDRDSVSDNVNVPTDDELPSYEDDQEDDDDFEKVIVKEFNLALRKWVTTAIVTDSDSTTVIESGNTPEMDPETPLKVEIYRNDIYDVTVKFKYSIRVYNIGDIEGYVKEIKDYIPEGLEFLEEDNALWSEISDGVVVTTQTEDILLEPGEYTDVEIILTWINGSDNMDLKTNIAEISKDDNEFDLPDINSEPDNFVDGEDDIDDAPVLLTTSTGQTRIYFGLIFVILGTITTGIVLIKKYVI